MSKIDEIKEGILLAQVTPREFDTNDYVHDVSLLLSKLEIAHKALEQTNHYIDAEAYTKAWKETIKALDQLKE